MSEWKRVKISEVSDFFIGGTPSRSNPKLWAEKPSGHPWIAISDLKQKYISDTEEHITGSGVIFSNVKEIPPESVVMSFKLSIGKAAITKQLMYCNEAIVFFKPHEELSSRWLYHAIPKAANAVIVDTAVKGSTLNKKKIADIELFLPDIEEQTTIATILDTLDTQIRQTEAIIAKLQQVKQGLLYDLLTRGIDENGQLRPPYEQAPELYKESPLGWIPKEWETVSLGDVASRSSGTLQTGPFGSQLHAEEYVAEGIPVIMPQDLNGERIDRAKVAYITENRARSLARHRVISNDVVFSRRGDLSRCVPVNEPEVGWLCGTGCLLARFPKNEILGEWLSLTYKKYWSQKQIEGMAVGSTMPNLNTGILSNLVISKPSSNEQQAVLNFYKESEQRQRFEEKSLEKLKKQKAGLMDDLLTGRVRVTELIEQAQQASSPEQGEAGWGRSGN